MLLNCKINQPIDRANCQIVIAGVKDLAFLNWSPSISALLGGLTDCPITLTELSASVGSEKFYEVVPADGSAVATATLTVGANKDSKAINHSVTGQLNSVNCDLLGDEFKNLSLGYFVIAVLDKAGKTLLYGVDNGLNASTFEFSSGTLEGDAVGINFVFDGLQFNAPLVVDAWASVQALFPA